MEWLVVIDEEGIQQQFKMGTDTKSAASEESGLKNKAKSNFKTHERIVFIFSKNGGWDPIEEMPAELRPKDWYLNKRPDAEKFQENFEEYYKKLIKELHGKYKAWSGPEFHGYTIRKTTLKNYIEVLAELDAKDYEEFHTKYKGYRGAIEILYSTQKLLHPHVETSQQAGEKVIKWVKKLQAEEELDEE